MAISSKEIEEILERDHIVADLSNSAHILISIVDSNANFLRVNQMFVDVLGYEREEIVGRNYLTMVHPDDLEKTIKVWDDLVSGSTQNTGHNGFTNRYKCKNGKHAILEWHANNKSIRGLALSIAIFKGYE